MKKLFYISTLFIFTLIIFHSCSKEATLSPEPSIEQQIDDMHKTFLVIQESKPNVTITFSLKDNKLVSLIEAPNNNTAFRANYVTNADPVCEGEGISFAKCVKKLLDAGKCVIITSCAYCAYETNCP